MKMFIKVVCMEMRKKISWGKQLCSTSS